MAIYAVQGKIFVSGYDTTSAVRGINQGEVLIARMNMLIFPKSGSI